MSDDIAKINKKETSEMLMGWAHDLRCSSQALWILLELMTTEEEERAHALITLVTQTIENVTTSINKFDDEKL